MFLGAGVARACGLPDIRQLQDLVLQRLELAQRNTLTNLLANRNLEGVLSRLRRIGALVTGDQTIDGLSRDQATDLDAAICLAIVKELDIAKAELTPVNRLAAWMARAEYRLPIELFTVNYDLLLETALEQLRVPYFDGFVGNLKARFHTELVEGTLSEGGDTMPSFFLRLWKLHGSVNWAWQADRQIVRLGTAVADQPAAIYPSDTKYEESRRVPFVVLQDRFRRALHQSETLTIVAGYSFSDDHLNELIFDAATRRERSEFMIFCFSTIPENLAARACTTPNLQVLGGEEAILGGVRAPWKAPENAPLDLWSENRLALRDFRNLTAYLARSATGQSLPVLLIPQLAPVEGTNPQGEGETKANG